LNSNIKLLSKVVNGKISEFGKQTQGGRSLKTIEPSL
jgi:hypothetical protein